MRKLTTAKSWSQRFAVLGLSAIGAFGAHTAQAECGDSVDAQGKVFYVIPDGDLVKREVTLTVPACGQGAVVISSASGWRKETTTFFTKHHGGQTTFVVVFQDPQGDNPNHYLTLKGSYLRGKNLATYWGDLYKLTLPEGTPSNKQAMEKIMDGNQWHHYGSHAGGFVFKADVPPPAAESPSESLFQ